MTDFSALDNPIWNSLNSGHRASATIVGAAACFPTDVSPLIGLRDGSEEAFDDLSKLLGPDGRAGTFTGYALNVPDGWTVQHRVIDQMICTDRSAFNRDGIEPLGEQDLPDMLALAAATEPGPFQARTATLGRFFGIRAKDGRLAAMAGQRLSLDGFLEISAVCTDPDCRGHGFARSIVSLLASDILATGKIPFLHVKTENAAKFVYEKAGFTVRSPMHLNVLTKL
jgi:ribosomal protein S18 acetylase RimI-like enzyme